MRNKISFVVIWLLLGLGSCQKEEPRSSLPLSNYLAEEYSIYRVQIDGVSTYYFDSSSLLVFLSAYGLESPNVFDYNSNGVVDASDFTETLSGFGNQYTPNYDLYSSTIDFQASSGWQIQLPPWPVSFIKVTPWDENPPGSFIPDTLKSFFLEGVNEEGQFIKIWHYRKS